MLSHQKLYPPRSIQTTEQLFEFFDRVGCIQFDPINVLGQNANLVLQSRYRNYRPDILENLLYHERSLLDGFDKVASIYPSHDWPHFQRRREAVRDRHEAANEPPMKAAPKIMAEIHTRGPLSSIDFKDDQKYDWTWGQPVRVARASLEILFAMGKLGIHHRIGSRRVFDAIENLLPNPVLSTADPITNELEYQEWHVLRRVGGLGLAHAGAGERWLGIQDVKSNERRAALARLVDQKRVVSVGVEGLEKETFFLRDSDRATLEEGPVLREEAAFIAPLDNLTWDRKMLRWLFDFDYIWEVYKPVEQRKYGYYVLPVLQGEKIVARVEPRLEKDRPILRIDHWWWEKNVSRSEEMEEALIECVVDFANYLEAEEIKLTASIRRRPSLGWLVEAGKRLAGR